MVNRLRRERNAGNMMPAIPKTTGQTIASNLHACQIICERDVERVAKQIDKGQAPLIAALERAESFLTCYRDGKEAQRPALHEVISEVRLALHDELTGTFRP